MHLGPFGCLTKLSAKRDELAQKFLARSHVVIFCNEHIRLTPLGPKLMFCAIRTIWVHLAPFGCLTKLGAKRSELVQKFVPRSRVRIFRNERSQSIPVDPKLMFWSVLFNLGALRTVWLRYETRCKTDRIAKVRATKFCHNFSQQTHPIHPIGP